MPIHVCNKRHSITGSPQIYIGRPSPLGNPYSSKASTVRGTTIVDSRQKAIALYEQWLAEQIRSNNRSVCDELNHIHRLAKAGDVYLICWCSPLPCHGDIIKATIEKHL